MLDARWSGALQRFEKITTALIYVKSDQSRNNPMFCWNGQNKSDSSPKRKKSCSFSISSIASSKLCGDPK